MIPSTWRLRVPFYAHSEFPLISTETTLEPRRGVFGWVEGINGVDLALRLTLLMLLLRPIGNTWLRPLILSAAVGGLLFPQWLRSPSLWLGLTVLTGLRVTLDWSIADNHAYLLCYWCLAISLALISHNVPSCLALNGRLLIGLAFAFAVIWKLVLSPDYLDGRFFRVMMLTDQRFSEWVQLASGLTPEALDELRNFVHPRKEEKQPADEPLPLPQEPARFLWLARVSTWWTVIIESAVAVSFLWPLGRGISLLRDIFLLGFCLTTYLIVMVEGFGWLLLSMGIAQCDPQRNWVKLGYLITFAVILWCREVPWIGWALEHLASSSG